MKTSSRTHNEILIIDVAGRIDPSTTPLFEQELLKFMSSSQSSILMNLRDVDYISSSGLRVFLTAIKKAKAENRELKACCLNSNIYKIFQIAGFLSMFDITDSEEDALKRFRFRS